MCGHPHPSRPGEAISATPRVQHRRTKRFGRLASECGSRMDTVSVLFDGDSEARKVLPGALRYVDEPDAAGPIRTRA